MQEEKVYLFFMVCFPATAANPRWPMAAILEIANVLTFDSEALDPQLIPQCELLNG